MEPLFLALDEIREIHAQQIDLYGGSDGVREPADLESAVATPMATFGGESLHSTTPSTAAAYLFRICQNYPPRLDLLVVGRALLRDSATARHNP